MFVEVRTNNLILDSICVCVCLKKQQKCLKGNKCISSMTSKTMRISCALCDIKIVLIIICRTWKEIKLFLKCPHGKENAPFSERITFFWQLGIVSCHNMKSDQCPVLHLLFCLLRFHLNFRKKKREKEPYFWMTICWILQTFICTIE